VSKKILLIDSDEGFAQGLASSINARGFVATTATNSEQGMSLAKQENPDLIVVCVEAQPTNGYMLCTRLKKDDQLKGIPVILTSANATPDSFEKHKKLKTRAEEYLIKPFEPSVMLEKASALMGVQLPPEQHEEIVAVEDEPLGLGDLVEGEDEPISLSAADAQAAHSGEPEEALVVDEVEEVSVQEEQPAEDDLDMFDKAFDSLGGPAVQPAAEQTSRFGLNNEPSVVAAPEPEPEQEEPAREPTELSAPDDAAVLDTLSDTGSDEIRSHLEARVAELEQQLAERTAELEQAKKGEGSSGSVLKLKEAKTRSDKEVLRLKEELHAKEKELLDLQESQTALESQAQTLKDDSVKREAAAKALQQRADALAAAAKKFERELTAAREEAKKSAATGAKMADLEKAHADLKAKHDEASAEAQKHKEHAGELETELTGAREAHGEELEKVKAEAEAARAEIEQVRTDLAALTGEKDLVSEERDELKKQLEEAQVTAVQNEDRAVKAYAKIKNEEKLREKAKKALQIALQLLEENATDEEEATSEKKSA
jgi:CheY-like chemotaxis protein